MSILSFFGYPLHRPYTITLCILICLFIVESTGNLFSQNKFTARFPFILIFALSLFSLNVFSNRLSGEYYMAKALTMQSKQNFGGMMRMIRKSENKYYTMDNSSTPIDWYKGFALYYQGNDSAMYYYKLAEQQNSYHVQTLSDIGALLENQGKHEEAISYLNRVVYFVPGYYEAHYNLAVAYFNLGKSVEALREINVQTSVGDGYLNTLNVILARNAEVASRNCGDSIINQAEIKDKPFLRSINKVSLEKKIAFAEIFCDSILARRSK